MPIFPQKRSSLFFTTVLIAVIILMLTLLISILREGQDFHEFAVKEPEPEVQTPPSSHALPAETAESHKTPAKPPSRASTDASKSVMAPAPDFEPSGTEEQGE